MNRLPGRATRTETARFHARAGAAPGSARVAEALFSLTVSSVGLGSYLGHDDDEADALYRAATSRALALGINVLDTASNYRSQRSERALGAALREAVASGAVAREAVVVASKVGYLPFDGQRPRHLGPWVEERFLKPGIFRREELAGGMHCMAPRYIDHVLEQSRANLGLETIDLYYLHNPESGLDGVARPEWSRRVRAAFEALERAVSDGRIGCYGTATWGGYREPPDREGHLGLEALLALAAEVGGADHHFRAVQLPVNLAMIEALASPTQPSARAGGALRPLLEVAADHGLCVMASASILQGQLTRGLGAELSAAIDAASANHPAGWSDAQRAIQFTRSLPGLHVALVGMKQEAHVEAAAAFGAVAPMPAPSVAELLSRFGD